MEKVEDEHQAMGQENKALLDHRELKVEIGQVRLETQTPATL